MKKKLLSHIIAVTACAVFIVLVMACATTMNPPREIAYNTAIPENQTATLLITDSIVVLEFNGKRLNPIWEAPNWGSPNKNLNTKVKIPAGSHTIRAYTYDPYGKHTNPLTVTFNAVAERAYKLDVYILSENVGMSGGSIRYTYKIYEISQAGEPGPDEQLLLIEHNRRQGSIIVLDKGTDEERSFHLNLFSSGRLDREPSGELRVIVPKGEHTIDFELPQSQYSKFGFRFAVEPERNFTASSEPVRYMLERTPASQKEPSVVTLTRK